MKRIISILIFTMMLSLMVGLAFAGDKYYVPSWNMPQGNITTFPKGHTATTEYTPNANVNYDKQHKPWFKSTLKPQNLRREGQSDLLEDAGNMFSGMFSKK